LTCHNDVTTSCIYVIWTSHIRVLTILLWALLLRLCLRWCRCFTC